MEFNAMSRISRMESSALSLNHFVLFVSFVVKESVLHEPWNLPGCRYHSK